MRHTFKIPGLRRWLQALRVISRTRVARTMRKAARSINSLLAMPLQLQEWWHQTQRHFRHRRKQIRRLKLYTSHLSQAAPRQRPPTTWINKRRTSQGQLQRASPRFSRPAHLRIENLSATPRLSSKSLALRKPCRKSPDLRRKRKVTLQQAVPKNRQTAN